MSAYPVSMLRDLIVKIVLQHNPPKADKLFRQIDPSARVKG